MKAGLWLVFTWCAVICLAGATAQTADEATAAFKDSLLNHQFTLRNFSGETKVEGEWSHDVLKMETPRWHAMGVLTVNAVDVKGREVKLACTRYILVHGKSGNLVLSPQTEPVEVRIKIHDGDLAQVLPQLKGALFFATPGEALAMIPAAVRGGIPASIQTRRLSNATATGYLGDWVFSPSELTAGYERVSMNCGCATVRQNECLDASGRVAGHAPRITVFPQPELTERAVEAHANGSVRLALVLNAKGSVTDTWIARPVGFGMDEEAAFVYRDATFHPAVCHNAPIPSVVYVECPFAEIQLKP